MERKKCMGSNTFKDHTIDFLSWMNDHHRWLNMEEKKKLCEGFEKVINNDPLYKVLKSMRLTVIGWIQEWRGKHNHNAEQGRLKVLEEFPKVLQTYSEALSLCDTRELSGVEEKDFKSIKEYFRSLISSLSGNSLEESEDLIG